MITSIVGKLFLEAYNEKYGTSYDAKSFFVKEFYPLFFDHNKYMMTAGNSPLENPKLSWADMIKGKKPYETASQRLVRYNKLMSKIEGSEADASIARGYPSVDVNATTSGQVTDMALPLSVDDVYYSWIGDGLGVCVQGGLNILFYHKGVLLDIYDGWKLYRNALNATSFLKGNQVNSWNGQWISHVYDSIAYVPQEPMAGFNPYDQPKDGIMSVAIQSWTKVLINIAKRWSEEQIIGYVYNIGQTNTTMGFVPFYLNQIRLPILLYKKIFNANNEREAEPLWGTARGFKATCSFGSVGLRAMEPKNLIKYIKGASPKAAKTRKEEITYNGYKIWILAMLNNDELWEKSRKLASLLKEASCDKEKSVSTKRGNMVNTVLESVNKKQFVASVTEIMSFLTDDDKRVMTEIVKDVHLMPSDNVPYFLTLVRFQYETL